MEGVVNGIVEQVMERLSVRGSWGSLIVPQTPAADPLVEFDHLPAPEAPKPGPSGVVRGPGRRKKKKKKKKKRSAAPVLEYFGRPKGGQEQHREEPRKEVEEPKPEAPTWAMVAGRRGGQNRPSPRPRSPTGSAGGLVVSRGGGGGPSSPTKGGGPRPRPQSPSRPPMVHTRRS